MKKIAIVVLLIAAASAAGQDMPLSQILAPGEGWHKFTSSPFVKIGGLAADSKGRVYVSEAASHRVSRIDPDGKVVVLARLSERLGGLAVDAEGRVFVTQPGEGHILRIDDKGEGIVVAGDLVGVQDLVVTRRGDIYCTIPADRTVLRISREGARQVVDRGIGSPTGIILWPDQATLVVADAADRCLWTFRINQDGTLSAKDRYYALRGQPDVSSGARGMSFDAAGRLYVTTLLGVQVFDPTGRLCGVLAQPPGHGRLLGVVFGGANGDSLIIATEDQLFARKTLAKGLAWKTQPKGR